MDLFRNKFFIAILIFSCAAIFRLTNIDLMEFKLDEARDVHEMNLFFKEPYLFQRGTIQSTGVYNPPLWYFFLALISLPSRNPEYLSFVIALINCLAVAGFYLVVEKFYGQRIGILSALLLAFSPWAILLSRKIWSPDLILPIVVPIFYFLHVVRSNQAKKWAWFFLIFLLMLLGQIHASGWFLGVGLVVSIIFITVIKIIKINLKFALIGFLAGLVPLLPFMFYQAGNGCPDCQNLFGYTQGSALQAQIKTFDPKVFLRPFEFLNGASFQLVLGGDMVNFLDNPILQVINMLFLVEFLLAAAGAIYIFKVCSRLRLSNNLFLLAVPVIVSLLYFITQTPGNMHYFVIVLPFMIMLYSLGLEWLFHLEGVKAHLRGVLAWGIITIIIVINVIFTFSFFNFLDQKQIINGDYGPVFRVSNQQAEIDLAKYKSDSKFELIRAEYWVNSFQNQLPLP